MTDCNAGSFTTGNYSTSAAYTGNYFYRNYIYYDGGPYRRREPPPVTVITKIVEVPVPEQKNRKENNMAINRQTFLDALTDEGKSIGSEGREIVKEAKADKWELFIARLLARAFESGDLAMLKEKPKEVLIKEA